MSRKRIMNFSSGQRRSLFVRAAAVIIALCMIAALALPALAAETADDASQANTSEAAAEETAPQAESSKEDASDTYTYTVRLFAGKKGTVNGQNVVTYEVEPGEELIIEWQKLVQVTDERYHATGFRESGKDNNTHDQWSNAFKVDRDMDFVVSYAIAGSDVPYTIHYVDEATKEDIHEAVTYYGNAGDKPVAAYLYIDGYKPNYTDLTEPLTEGGANEWTFTYKKVVAEKDSSTTTTTEKDGTTTKTTLKDGTTTTTTQKVASAAMSTKTTQLTTTTRSTTLL